MVLVIFGVARFSKMVGKAVNHRKPRRRLNELNVNPGWSTWGSWSVCSERKCCRHGVMVRHRNCAKGPCTGIESEAEDCPRRGCKECSWGPLADAALAVTGSLINVDCETTVKYSASGKFSYLLPPSIYKEFPALKKVLRSGFFGVQKLSESVGRRESKKRIVYKFCFEPKRRVTSRQARHIFLSNRRVRLSYPDYDLGPTRVNAIVITVLPSGKLFKPGIYFTATERRSLMAFYRYC